MEKNERMLDLIADNQKRIEKNLDCYMSETRQELKEIRQQTTKTNGTVMMLKNTQDNCPIDEVIKQTEFIRFFTKNWKIAIFIVVLCLMLISARGLAYFIDLIK